MTYITLKLEECLVVVVCSELRMRGKSLEEDLVHGHCLLERSQILPIVYTSEWRWREGMRGG